MQCSRSINFTKVLNAARRDTDRFDETDNSPELWDAFQANIVAEHNKKVNANPHLKKAKADFDKLSRKHQLGIQKLIPNIPSWWIKNGKNPNSELQTKSRSRSKSRSRAAKARSDSRSRSRSRSRSWNKNRFLIQFSTKHL